MADTSALSYEIKDPIELNLCYMPFVDEGGLFIPTPQSFFLGDRVIVDLLLPGKKDSLKIEGKVIWITPKNALHHVLAGIGIQFMGANAQTIRSQLEALLDKTVEVGGYTYGMTDEVKKR